jgi:hypothetical protein
MSYDVTLTPIDKTDNPDYGWTGAGYASNSQNSCGSCHNGLLSSRLTELDEWFKDGHSRAFTHAYFRTTYMGTDVYGNQSQQIKWESQNGQKICRSWIGFSP